MAQSIRCRVMSIKQVRDKSEPTRVVDIRIKCGSAGFVHASVEPDYGVLRHFEADPEGRGLGRSAYPLVEAYLAGQGCREIFLTATSPAVESFWRTVGFTGHVEMRKSIKRTLRGGKSGNC